MIEKNNPDLTQKELATIQQKVDEQVNGFGKSDDNPANNSFGIKTTPVFAKAEQNLGLVQAVAGTAIMMLLFTVTGMGSGMLLEKEEGTLKKLLYSPIQPDINFVRKNACNYCRIHYPVVRNVHFCLAGIRIKYFY